MYWVSEYFSTDSPIGVVATATRTIHFPIGAVAAATRTIHFPVGVVSSATRTIHFPINDWLLPGKSVKNVNLQIPPAKKCRNLLIYKYVLHVPN